MQQRQLVDSLVIRWRAMPPPLDALTVVLRRLRTPLFFRLADPGRTRCMPLTGVGGSGFALPRPRVSA